MKNLLLPLFCSFFLWGCASSERMARLSGGVVQEYSAPRKHRLRSEKFQNKTESFSRQKQSVRKGFSEKSLINIWPFFFRSDDYYSALWPIFDYDPYGMAIRPLFNREGDDYSILFPLSAWNTVSKSGWITLYFWDKDMIGLFPVFSHSFNPKRGKMYYTPLFERSWKFMEPDYFNPSESEVKTHFLSGYYNKKIKVDTSDISYFRYYNWKKYPDTLKQLLAYKFYKTATPVPQNFTELDALRKKLFMQAPRVTETNYGLFPLFFAWDEKVSQGFNIAGLLWHHNRRKKDFITWSLAGLLYSNSIVQYDPLFSMAVKERTVIPVLMTFSSTTSYIKETPLRKDVLRFNSLAGKTHEPFAKNLPEMKKLYKKLAGEDMPQVICSYALAKLWVEEFAAKQKWEIEKESSGGFLPLFNYFNGRKSFFWNSPLLLTFNEKAKDTTFFLSIPLLTYHHSLPRESLQTTAGKIGYYSKTIKGERINRPVFDAKTYWVKEHQQHYFEDTYALCGLFYHGRDGFSIVRDGFDAKLVESIRKRAFELKSRNLSCRNAERQLDKRLELNKNWQVKSRLDELKKMVDAEEIRIEREKTAKQKAELEKDIFKWQGDVARCGVKLDKKSLEDKNFNTDMENFLEKTTRIRYFEDFGSGIFFRKELAENGDFKWHILAYLASGSKQGTHEKTQIMHFLYRKNKDGEREETIIFPFIAIRKEKERSSSSFLWRLWETHESGQGKGGYIFFIPWGK